MKKIQFEKPIKVNLQWEIQKKRILDHVQCYEDNPLYEEISIQYESVWKRLKEVADARGVFLYTKLQKELKGIEVNEQDQVLYVIYTLGERASDLSRVYFARGEYMKGMLANTMADYAVFSMEDAVQQEIQALCEEQDIYVERRLEAPHYLPMEFQKVICEVTNAKELLEISVTKGYMLEPAKSCCQLYIMKENGSQSNNSCAKHSCKQCNNIKCSYREEEHR